MQPNLLLLDEPASGLSAEETTDLAFWIEDIKKIMGITVLMVEHDLNLVGKVADRVGALVEGNLVAVGSLKEIQEILFSKGLIKILFATETFSVGINMPTKTVIFTSLNKFSGSKMRDLLSHEYTQMAGRAGRRGIDTVGHVIHCNNLFRMPEFNTYKSMLTGPPKMLISQFKILKSVGILNARYLTFN